MPGLELSSLDQCATDAQTIAITWLNDHPKWMLTRWRCVAGNVGVPT